MLAGTAPYQLSHFPAFYLTFTDSQSTEPGQALFELLDPFSGLTTLPAPDNFEGPWSCIPAASWGSLYVWSFLLNWEDSFARQIFPILCEPSRVWSHIRLYIQFRPCHGRSPNGMSVCCWAMWVPEPPSIDTHPSKSKSVVWLLWLPPSASHG